MQIPLVIYVLSLVFLLASLSLHLQAATPYDHSSGVSALPEASLSVDDLLPDEDDLIDLDELLFPCSIAASVIRDE